MTEKEFKKLKVGDKIKASMQICYDLNPPEYVPVNTTGTVVKLTGKSSLIWVDFGVIDSIPCVAFEVEND